MGNQIQLMYKKINSKIAESELDIRYFEDKLKGGYYKNQEEKNDILSELEYLMKEVMRYKKKLEDKDGLIELKSVGSVIDTESGNIYPLFKDGTVDFTFGISLENEEVSSEWYEELSVKDYKLVEQIKKGFKLFPKYDGNRGWYMTNDNLKNKL